MAEKKVATIAVTKRRQSSVRIDADLVKEAKHRGLDEGRSWSEIVEVAVREYLQRHPAGKR